MCSAFTTVCDINIAVSLVMVRLVYFRYNWRIAEISAINLELNVAWTTVLIAERRLCCHDLCLCTYTGEFK